MFRQRITAADENAPNGYEEYHKLVNDAESDVDARRKKLTSACIEVYNYINSAFESITKLGYLEPTSESYDIYAPDEYAWFDDVNNAVANKAYDEYEKFYADAKELDEIIDILDDARYRLDKMIDKLEWVEGEK